MGKRNTKGRRVLRKRNSRFKMQLATDSQESLGEPGRGGDQTLCLCGRQRCEQHLGGGGRETGCHVRSGRHYQTGSHTHLCQAVTGLGSSRGVEEQRLSMDSAQAFFKICVLCQGLEHVKNRVSEKHSSGALVTEPWTFYLNAIQQNTGSDMPRK